MSEITEIVILGRPLPWKAAFVGCRGSYSVRTPIIHQIRTELCDYDGPFFEEAIRVDICFYFLPPKSASKKMRAKMLEGIERPTKRPDRTNLAKLYEDILIGIAYADDSLIVEGDVLKFYGEIEKTVFRIRPAIVQHS